MRIRYEWSITQRSALEVSIRRSSNVHQAAWGNWDFCRVRLAAEPPSAAVDRKDMSGPSFTVHVRFVTHNPVLVVDEEFLYNLFQPFGEIVDISIRRYYRQIRRQYGYAFVEYKMKEDAKTASGHFEHFESGGVKLFSTISHRSIKSWTGDDEAGRTGEAEIHSGHAHQSENSQNRRNSNSNMAMKPAHSDDPRSSSFSNRRNSPFVGGSAPSYFPGYSNHGRSPSMPVMLPPGYPIAMAPAFFPMASSMIPPPSMTHNGASSSGVFHRSSGSSQPFIAVPQHLLSQHSWSQGPPSGAPSSAPANYVSHPYSFPAPVPSSNGSAQSVPNTVHPQAPPQTSNQLPYYTYAQSPSSPMVTIIPTPSYPQSLGAPRPVAASPRGAATTYYPTQGAVPTRASHNPDTYEHSISSTPPHPSHDFR